jgi:FAD:protein FMN transferase
MNVIEKSLIISKESHGAFDITWIGLRKLYQLKKSNWKPPTEDQIKIALKSVGWKLIEIDKKNKRIRFKEKSLKVDLGAIAKGYGLALMGETFKKAGISNFIVNGGGDLVISGKHPNRNWTIAVRHPRKPRNAPPLVQGGVLSGAIVTSGDYERYVEVDGVRYSHIINPSTGKTARGVFSVTVSGPDATFADGLSTAIFVLGAEKGLNLISRFDGYEAMIITRENKTVKTSHFDNIWVKPKLSDSLPR